MWAAVTLALARFDVLATTLICWLVVGVVPNRVTVAAPEAGVLTAFGVSCAPVSAASSWAIAVSSSPPHPANRPAQARAVTARAAWNGLRLLQVCIEANLHWCRCRAEFFARQV